MRKSPNRYPNHLHNSLKSPPQPFVRRKTNSYIKKNVVSKNFKLQMFLRIKEYRKNIAIDTDLMCYIMIKNFSHIYHITLPYHKGNHSTVSLKLLQTLEKSCFAMSFFRHQTSLLLKHRNTI